MLPSSDNLLIILSIARLSEITPLVHRVSLFSCNSSTNSLNSRYLCITSLQPCQALPTIVLTGN